MAYNLDPSPFPVNGRTARGELDEHGRPRFSQEQRLWLLERDLDAGDESDAAFRKEVRTEMRAMRTLVTSRLNWIVGLGFSLLIAVVVALVTAVIAQ